MKKPRLSDLLLWKGQLAKIVGMIDRPSVQIQMLHHKECPHCGGDIGPDTITVIPSSPLFQESAEPVQTLIDDTKPNL